MENKDDTIKGCCTPSRGETPLSVATAKRVSSVEQSKSAILISVGKALVGTNVAGIPNDGETPLRNVNVKPFRISPTVVTNAEFAEFIKDTGHITEADQFGWSFVFWSEVPEHVGATQAVQGIEWWRHLERGVTTHALSRQLGNSTEMIDRHYSKYSPLLNAEVHSGRKQKH